MSTSPSINILASSTLISQGAEAKVYKAYLHPKSTPILLKYRFPKKYRHPSLDTSLTRSRIAGEARAIKKCLRAGVNVPGIRMVNAAEGMLGIEWVEGGSVRTLLPGAPSSEEESPANGSIESSGNSLSEYGISPDDLMKLIGSEIAKMHQADIIHSDLTTSNLMLRHPSSFKLVSDHGLAIQTELVLIDFGLAYQSALAEDKAVDLYVLERAFSSTHPDSEPLFASVLATYEERMGKGWCDIRKKLQDVRRRGRKRDMLG